MRAPVPEAADPQAPIIPIEGPFFNLPADILSKEVPSRAFRTRLDFAGRLIYTLSFGSGRHAAGLAQQKTLARGDARRVGKDSKDSK